MTTQPNLLAALLTIRDASSPEAGLMDGVDTWSALVERLQKIAGDAVAEYRKAVDDVNRMNDKGEILATPPARDAAEGAKEPSRGYMTAEQIAADKGIIRSAPQKPALDALDLLQLQQRGRAQAFRILDSKREISDPATLAMADAYEECGKELKAVLASAPVPPADETSITINREALYRAISNHLPSDMIDAIWQEVIEALELKP